MSGKFSHAIGGGLFCILAASASADAADTQHSHQSKYAGLEKRAIKSLSGEDIAELRRGGGWGLAKAAELNGLPGPLHLLELREEISLSDAQVTAITVLFENMRAQAVKEGARLLELEEKLERQFRKRRVSDGELQEILQSIGDVRVRLRYIHLSTHLKTPDILSQGQMAKYAQLRGYSTGDPCASVPTGHNPQLWRKHNNCPD